VSELVRSAADADARQAEYFRDFFARERRELVSDLSAYVTRLTVSMTTGSAGDVRQIRRCIRVTETEIRAIDRMVAALDYRFPDEPVRRRA
jgi:hypothetical protein